ncbi:hypothetical protein L1987_65444 [Smallanthus sonchifolius]|uniref:Uncharacterized protein n=1 Tax=Smallanthus sonchifolius TaxID=185202 RepID=A0ACB9BUE0_9ASTR|nr:hypothetical protein L1987_65444 [Smallanthus sonchifolius]
MPMIGDTRQFRAKAAVIHGGGRKMLVRRPGVVTSAQIRVIVTLATRVLVPISEDSFADEVNLDSSGSIDSNDEMSASVIFRQHILIINKVFDGGKVTVLLTRQHFMSPPLLQLFSFIK